MATPAENRKPVHLSEGDGGSRAPWEHELKYVVSRQSLEAVRCHLESLCLPDHSYPENTVASIYFDTPDFGSAREKFNGDNLKTKFRIRWYEQGGNFSRAFAEVKQSWQLKCPRRLSGEEPMDICLACGLEGVTCEGIVCP